MRKDLKEKPIQPKMSEPPKILGFLGPRERRVPVHFRADKYINGRTYQELHTVDGSVYILNDADVASQLKSSPDAE